MGVNRRRASLRHLADVEQQAAARGEAADGIDKTVVRRGVAVAVALQYRGIRPALAQGGGNVAGGTAGNQGVAGHGHGGVYPLRAQSARRLFRRPQTVPQAYPPFRFRPLRQRAEMRVGKTVGRFGADLAAADGGEQFAVKGDDALRQAEAEGGGGRGQIARRVAARRAERPLRAGQHQRFVQTVQREGEQIGRVGQRIRAVQHQHAVVLRDFFCQQDQPVAPVFQRYGGRINQRRTNVPIEREAV